MNSYLLFTRATEELNDFSESRTISSRFRVVLLVVVFLRTIIATLTRKRYFLFSLVRHKSTRPIGFLVVVRSSNVRLVLGKNEEPRPSSMARSLLVTSHSLSANIHTDIDKTNKHTCMNEECDKLHGAFRI